MVLFAAICFARRGGGGSATVAAAKAGGEKRVVVMKLQCHCVLELCSIIVYSIRGVTSLYEVLILLYGLYNRRARGIEIIRL